jgi:hypothetical protein
MARSTVRLNSSEVQSYLDGSHGVREMLRGKAEQVLAAAQADPHDASGDYEASLEIAEDRTDRLVFRVGSSIEYVYVQEARYGVLSRALDAAG